MRHDDQREVSKQHPMQVPDEHEVLGTPLEPPFPDEMRELIVGMGCFWSPEQLFWKQDGVYTTAVGYAGGDAPHPTYKEVCRGDTGHAEVVRVVYDPEVLSDQAVMGLFWNHHTPSSGRGVGIDRTSQYRSALLTVDEDQFDLAKRMRADYQQRHDVEVATDLRHDVEFFYAEPYHQQYRAKRGV